MHRKAKVFFFVSAGILCLALTYHLGAHNATAQSPGEQLVDIAWRRADGYAYAVSTSGAIYATPGYCQPWTPVGHMPAGCVPVSVLDGDVGGSLDIACADGLVWTVQGSVPSVSLAECSDVFGAPTPATSSTSGQVKARWSDRAAPRQGEGSKRIVNDGR